MHRHKAVEKSENPRTGSATRAALALAVPVPRRTTAARRPGSPHLGLPLPPTRWPTVHLRRATPKGREMRESENRLRNALTLSNIVAHCARLPAHSRRRFSTVENRLCRPPAPLASIVADFGAASALGTRDLKAGRTSPHVPPAPPPMPPKMVQPQFPSTMVENRSQRPCAPLCVQASV